MGRVEDNYDVLNIIDKSVEAGTYNASEAIALVLCDISRSLAIIADKMDEIVEIEVKNDKNN